MPAHHTLEAYLDEYVKAAGIAGDRKGPFFRTAPRTGGKLTRNYLKTAEVWRMIRRRAKLAGIKTAIGCHTFYFLLVGDPSGRQGSPTSRK